MLNSHINQDIGRQTTISVNSRWSTATQEVKSRCPCNLDLPSFPSLVLFFSSLIMNSREVYIYNSLYLNFQFPQLSRAHLKTKHWTKRILYSSFATQQAALPQLSAGITQTMLIRYYLTESLSYWVTSAEETPGSICALQTTVCPHLPKPLLM